MKKTKNILCLLFLAGLPILLISSIAYSAQCLAITKKGTQCKRQAVASSTFCWQHSGKASSVTVQKAQDNKASQTTVTVSTKTLENKPTQCQAITKKGKQCKRQAEVGSVFCWQHGGKSLDVSGISTIDIGQKSFDDSLRSKVSAGKKSSGKASTQCQAITKKGTQCKRKAKPGSRFCWQHEK